MKKDTTALKTYLYPMVSKSLETNNKKFVAAMGRFVQARASSLYDTGPFDRIFFGKDDIDDFFKSIGFTEQDVINKALSKTFYWDIPFKPIAAKDPFTVTMMMIIRYLIEKNNTKELEQACIYLAFSGKFYPSLHYNSYRKVCPSEHRAVMDYVINNRLSQKFDLKNQGSLFGAINSLCKTWISTYKGKIKSASDEDIAYCIEQLHNRIKSFMVNIAREYYKAYDNKEYLNFESDSFDKDNFRLTDSDATIAERAVEKSMDSFISKGVNYKFCTMCADQNIKKDEIKFIIESILDNNENLDDLKTVTRILICDFMAHNSSKDIRGIDFLAYSIKAKPNVKDENIIKMKSIILNWLDENSAQYRKRKSREATANSYYKAILQYIALTISAANKGYGGVNESTDLNINTLPITKEAIKDGNRLIIKNHGEIIAKLDWYDYDIDNFDWVLISDIDTKANYRRKGLATKLINKAYEEIINTTHKGIYLFVKADNDNAIKLYKKLHFKYVKEYNSNNTKYIIMAKGPTNISQLKRMEYATE